MDKLPKARNQNGEMERPYRLYNGEPVFSTEYIIHQARYMRSSVDRANTVSYVALALSILAVILAVVL